MPFRSEAQMRYMFADPRLRPVARRWAQEYGTKIRKESPEAGRARKDEAAKQKAHFKTNVLPKAIAREQGKYRPDFFARLAERPLSRKGKVGIAAGLTTAALAASPYSRRAHRQDTEQQRGKRAAVGAGAGAAGLYGTYAAGSYNANRLLGAKLGGTNKDNPQRGEIMAHMRSKGYKQYQRPHGVDEGSWTDRWLKHKSKQANVKSGALQRGFETMPHHIQGSGMTRLNARLYGPGTFGRKAVPVLALGGAAGAALGHGAPDTSEQRRRIKEVAAGRKRVAVDFYRRRFDD